LKTNESIEITTQEEADEYGYPIKTVLLQKVYEMPDQEYFCRNNYGDDVLVMKDRQRKAVLVWSRTNRSGKIYLHIEHTPTDINGDGFLNFSGYIAGDVTGYPISPILYVRTESDRKKIKFWPDIFPYLECPYKVESFREKYVKSIDQDTFDDAVGVNFGRNFPDPRVRGSKAWFSNCTITVCRED